MKKLNLVLFILALMALSGLIISVASVYAEDQPAMTADKDNTKNYDPCADPNCMALSAVTPQKTMAMKKGEDMPAQMCPKMQMMGKGMGHGMMHGKNQDKMMGMGKKGMERCPMCPMNEMMKGEGPMPGDPMYILANADKIKLTDQQKMSIDATHLAHQKDMIKMNADLEIAHVELEALMRNDPPDLDAVKTQLKKIADMDVELKFAQLKFGVDVKSVLTKEQLDTLKMMQEHEASKAKMDMPHAEMPHAEAKPMPEKPMEHKH